MRSRLGVSGATVVGHSIGGVVASSLAEQASELVGKGVAAIAATGDVASAREKSHSTTVAARSGVGIVFYLDR